MKFWIFLDNSIKNGQLVVAGLHNKQLGGQNKLIRVSKKNISISNFIPILHVSWISNEDITGIDEKCDLLLIINRSQKSKRR